MELNSSSFVAGLALGIVGAFGTGFLKKAGEDAYSWLKAKYGPKSEYIAPVPLVVRIDTPQGGPGETLPTEPANHVVIGDISKAINDAPPMQRDAVAQRFIGISVRWDCYFYSGDVLPDNRILVRLTPDLAFSGKYVKCEVSASEYRELGILAEGAKIRVSGEIARARSYEVELSDAHLHIFPQTSPA